MRKPVFQEGDRLSFLLQLGCEELTLASRKTHRPCFLPCGTHRQGGGQFFLPVFPLSVRKLSRGARVYSSGLCRMRVIIHLERKSLVFSFFLLFPSMLVSSPWPLRTSIPFLFSFSLYPQWSFRSRHHSLKRTQSQLEMERPSAFQSFSPLLQGDGACVR